MEIMHRHHLLEIILWPNGDGTFRTILNSQARLEELGIYKDFKCTIKMTESEHSSLHANNRPNGFYERFIGAGNPNADGHSMRGKHHSKETKLKMRNAFISDFGRKFIEHYGFERKDNDALWMREYRYHKKHNKCSWE